MFTGAATDDVYLWTSLVKQYFVFMCGNAQQEVAFAATLLRGSAHEWYMGYERRNGNRPPRDWPTMMQAILERFGSNIRAQEAHAKLLTVSQGKRSVRDYTSELETLLGRLSTRDEDTWKRMYVWGLQPHLAKAVALSIQQLLRKPQVMLRKSSWQLKPLKDLILVNREHVPLHHTVHEEDPKQHLDHLHKVEVEEI